MISADISKCDSTYYAKKLSGIKLEKVYELAGNRVRKYLKKEMEHIASMLKPNFIVLELGCGYGRVLSDNIQANIIKISNLISNTAITA